MQISSKNKTTLWAALPIYLTLLIIIFTNYGHLFVYVLFCLSSLYFFWINVKNIYILPCIYLPFMFLVRNQDKDSLVIAILPDITVVVAIIYFIIKLAEGQKISILQIRIFIFGLASFLLSVAHLQDFSSILVLVRHILIPPLFLMAIIGGLRESNEMIKNALVLSINSYFITSILALLNYFQLIQLNQEFIPLFPYLSYDTEKALEQNLDALSRANAYFSLPRLKLPSGNALGSTAAIIAALGIVLLLFKPVKSVIFRSIAALILLATSILTLSNSILIPVVLAMPFYFRNIAKRKLNIIIFSVLSIYILSLSAIFVEVNAMTYFLNTVMAGFFKVLSNLNFLSLMIGYGPDINSMEHLNIAKDAVTDIGIFRVFAEYGLFVFLIYVTLLISIFKNGVKGWKNSSLIGSNFHLYIFLVYLFLVHGNIIMIAPYYALFAVSVSGILASARADQLVSAIYRRARYVG